jgi:hypothetical protein
MSFHEGRRYRDKACPVCETAFRPRTGRQTYCSPECQHGRSTCLGCGKRFVRKKSAEGTYCSRECWYKAPGKREIAPRACLECGKQFQPSDSSVKRCSKECRIQGRRNPARRTECEKCGKPLRPDCHVDTRFCSHSCAKKGESHDNYGRVQPEGTRRVHMGYVKVKVGGKWLLEHRYVMEQELGRPLARHEHVHHINGDKTCNQPGNLELWKGSHPHGVKASDYHCAGCYCHTKEDMRIIPH